MSVIGQLRYIFLFWCSLKVYTAILFCSRSYYLVDGPARCTSRSTAGAGACCARSPATHSAAAAAAAAAANALQTDPRDAPVVLCDRCTTDNYSAN